MVGVDAEKLARVEVLFQLFHRLSAKMGSFGGVVTLGVLNEEGDAPGSEGRAVQSEFPSPWP